MDWEQKINVPTVQYNKREKRMCINLSNKKNQTTKFYRIDFGTYGCSIGRIFIDKDKRDKFAESMKRAGYRVHTYES